VSGGRVAVVDTSVVIAWQNRSEPSHARAVELIAAWPDLLMHTVNVAELLVGTPETAWTGLLEMLRTDGFTFHDTTAQELARARRETGLRMPDACVIALARARRANGVLSFDAKLSRAAQAEGFATGAGPGAG
jgi:predicted nucleic acid-binding protein